MEKIQFDKYPDFYSPIYDHLRNILKKGACIFFGAGISKMAGYKLWEELKIKIVDYFWANRHNLSEANKLEFDYSFYQNLREHENTIETFDYLFMLDKDLFVNGIKEIFSEDEQKSNHRIFKLLSKLNNGNSFFITTNIDKGFQKCLNIADQNTSIYPVLGNPPKLLNYIHGRIDYEETWIFIRKQYIDGYSSDNSPCLRFLREIFSKNSVIFFGYGLREPEILSAISRTRKMRRHYWIQPISRHMLDNLKIKGSSLLENYNITYVPYSIEYEGHNAVFSVIESLNKAIR